MFDQKQHEHPCKFHHEIKWKGMKRSSLLLLLLLLLLLHLLSDFFDGGVEIFQVSVHRYNGSITFYNCFGRGILPCFLSENPWGSDDDRPDVNGCSFNKWKLHGRVLQGNNPENWGTTKTVSLALEVDSNLSQECLIQRVRIFVYFIVDSLWFKQFWTKFLHVYIYKSMIWPSKIRWLPTRMVFWDPSLNSCGGVVHLCLL